jgi:hypothetical protein
MGTEEDVLRHEQDCLWNRDKRTCATCKKCDRGFLTYKCNDGKEIPDGQMFVNCDKYEWDEVDHATKHPVATNSIFGGLFG